MKKINFSPSLVVLLAASLGFLVAHHFGRARFAKQEQVGKSQNNV